MAQVKEDVLALEDVLVVRGVYFVDAAVDTPFYRVYHTEALWACARALGGTICGLSWGLRLHALLFFVSLSYSLELNIKYWLTFSQYFVFY